MTYALAYATFLVFVRPSLRAKRAHTRAKNTIFANSTLQKLQNYPFFEKKMTKMLCK